MTEHLLPRFEDTEAGQQLLWEWQATRMQNYMNYLILYYDYKPKYYDPYADKKDEVKEIQAHHIACFYGVTMAQIFSCRTLIDTMFSVCECLDSVPCVKEAITQDAYKDLYWCMHFVDNLEADSEKSGRSSFMIQKL